MMWNDLKYDLLRIFWTLILVPGMIFALSAQFSIGPGGYVTVKSGGSMMIGTDVHIKSVAGASGYLVDQNVNGDIDITGDATVERYLSPNVWHNVSSPVSSATTGVYAGTDLVFWYNEALILHDWNFGWVWYTGPTGGPLMVFRGYDVYYYTNPVTVNYLATGAANLNTGPYSITVINTSSSPSEIPSHKGWNLLGNPYPSPVDWLAASGWNKSSINDAKYIWDGTNNIYTIFLGGGSPIGLNGGTRFIPSNQGFWVQSVVESGTVSINNATRVGNISGTPDYYKLAPADYPMVSLVARGNTYSDEVVVRFLQGSTSGTDRDLDASKLFSPVGDVPQVSILSGKSVLALSTLPQISEGLSVSVGFRCARAGNYTLNLASRTRLDDTTRVWLRDDLLRKMTDLRADTAYSFFHDPDFPENRFTLYFNPYEDIIHNLSPEDWFTVYTSGNHINIIRNTNRELTGEIIVYNILGQEVMNRKLTDDDRIVLGMTGPSGYYVVSIITPEAIINAKVLL
jgi:hypothetical protein